MNKGNKKVKKVRKVRRIKYGRIFIIFVLLFLIIYLIYNLVDFKIKNIFISNNSILTDQEIIELANIDDYPSIFKYSDSEIEKRLEKNIFIKNATVTKKDLNKVYIDIEENYPLFYNSSLSLTILKDSSTVQDIFNIPVLINYVPDTIYDSFIEKMGMLDKNILIKISEIEYKPNEVDENRFLFYMNDGNYVYLTLSSFENINKYLDIVVQIIDKYENKKGILYLDDGGYFEILEN